MKTAVLVIDVQQGLCEGDHAAFEVHEVIERINKVSAQARAVGAIVAFVQHESKSGYLEFNSHAWQLARGLHVEPTDLRIRKTTPDCFHRTDLHETLKQHGVTDLVVCGMHTEFCVDTTTRRALALGYPIVLVADAHTTESNQYLSAAQIVRHHNDTLINISSFGPRVRAIATENLRIGRVRLRTDIGASAVDVSSLIDRYCEVWSEPDESKRAELLASVWGPHATYTDPSVHAANAEELLSHIARVQARRPGARVVRTSKVDLHHGMGRFAWHVVEADGTALPEGLDIAFISSEGTRIERIIGFFGLLAKEAE